jgi:hypothetical protein
VKNVIDGRTGRCNNNVQRRFGETGERGNGRRMVEACFGKTGEQKNGRRMVKAGVGETGEQERFLEGVAELHFYQYFQKESG